jgi:hypothetical protein
MGKHYFSKKTKSFERISAALVILIIAVIGVYVLTGSHAATPYSSLTANKGTLAGGAAAQACSGSAATNGQCVVFKGSGGGGGTVGGGANMIVGINEAGWGDTGSSKIAGAVKYDRFDTDQGDPVDILGGVENNGKGTKVNGLVSFGVKADLLFAGPYTHNNGVSTLTDTSVNGVDGITNWVNNTLSYYQQHCNTTECPMLEVLNEPAGWWFWGTGSGQSAQVASTTNADAYAKLVKATYTAFHNTYGNNAPLILGTVDGYGSAVQWGNEWWSAEGDASTYVDGVIVHPYGGSSNPSQSKLGNRALVTAANTTFKKPVYVTEVGWPTDTSGTTPTTTNATGDSMQWPQSNSGGGNQGDQCDNVYNFLSWARSVNYVNAVYIFGFTDYGTNNFYGMFDASGNTAKPAFGALKAAANQQANPCPNPPLTY